MAIRRAIRSISVIALAAGISFLPTAALNQLYAGQWAGDVNHSTGVQISNPIAGILGNTLQLGVYTILSPIFPPAQNWNSTVVPSIMESGLSAWLKASFLDSLSTRGNSQRRSQQALAVGSPCCGRPPASRLRDIEPRRWDTSSGATPARIIVGLGHFGSRTNRFWRFFR